MAIATTIRMIGWMAYGATVGGTASNCRLAWFCHGPPCWRVLNDWSIRNDMRRPRAMAFNLPKKFDDSTSLGPSIVVGDLDPHTTPIQTRVNGELRQDYSTVLGDLLAQSPDLETALTTFGNTRWGRCRLVNENSLQLGEWEKQTGDPNADPSRLIGESMAALAQPYRTAVAGTSRG